MVTITDIFKEYFNLDEVQEYQTKILDRITNNKDSVNLMLRVDEKVIYYEVASLILDKPVLVITEDVELHTNRVKSINTKEISNYTVSEDEIELKQSINKEYNVIYLPKSLCGKKEIINLLKKKIFGMAVIDNADTLSQYTHTFNPKDLAIVDFIHSLKQRPVISLFAGAITKKIKEELTRLLKLEESEYLNDILCEENLYIGIESTINKEESLIELLKCKERQTWCCIYCYN